MLAVLAVFILWSQFDGLKKPLELLMLVVGLGLILSRYEAITGQLGEITSGPRRKKPPVNPTSTDIITAVQWAATPFGRKHDPYGGTFESVLGPVGY